MTPSFGYVDCAVDPLAAVEYGVLAEKNGFDTLWIPDHSIDINGDRLEPWTVLSAVAVNTKTIRLASAVTDTQRTHPARTAHMVVCLDAISGGRAVLGIGAGEAMNIVPFGLSWETPKERVARLVEGIQVIRALWAGSRSEPANFSGRFYRLENAFLSQSPKQEPYPPIFVGAFASKRMLEVVGRFGDGWYGWLNTPDLFRKRWSIIKLAAESAGRVATRIVASSHVVVSFPRNSEERKRSLMAGKVALVVEKTLLRDFGYVSETQDYQHLIALSKEGVAKIKEAAERVPDDIVYRAMAIGGIEEAKEKVEQLLKAGVTDFAVVDLLAPKTVKRTLNIFRRIIQDYK